MEEVSHFEGSYDSHHIEANILDGSLRIKVITDKGVLEGGLDDAFAKSREFDDVRDLFDLLRDNIENRVLEIKSDGLYLKFTFNLKGKVKERMINIPMKLEVGDEKSLATAKTKLAQKALSEAQLEAQDRLEKLRELLEEQAISLSSNKVSLERQRGQTQLVKSLVERLTGEVEALKEKLSQEEGRIEVEIAKVEEVGSFREEFIHEYSVGLVQVAFDPDKSNEFAKKFFSISDTKIVTKQTDDEFAQIVGLQAIPFTGIYSTSIRLLDIGDKKICMFGVVTSAGRGTKSCSAKDEININFAGRGYTNVEGTSTNVNCFDVCEGDKVIMLVDRANRKITWFSEGVKLISTKMSEEFATKELYPKIELKSVGTKVQLL